ncbi:dihydrofolate reductase [Vibrio phage pVa-21]|nr:dihydrofolate reductase [Vibrio phage pVa-21]
MIGMIVAHDLNLAIGNKGKLLWHSPEDLQHFKETTMGGTLVFGRETAESIGRPLPGRECIVLSKDFNYQLDGFTTLTPETIDRSWLESIAGGRPLWICGGGTIYDQCMEMVDKVVVSVVHTEIEEADAYFPQYRGWLETRRLQNSEPFIQFAPNEKCPHPISVFEYVA